jgi:hypothetical protein
MGEPLVIGTSSDCQGVNDRIENSDLVCRCAFTLDSRDWSLLAIEGLCRSSLASLDCTQHLVERAGPCVHHHFGGTPHRGPGFLEPAINRSLHAWSVACGGWSSGRGQPAAVDLIEPLQDSAGHYLDDLAVVGIHLVGLWWVELCDLEAVEVAA